MATRFSTRSRTKLRSSLEAGFFCLCALCAASLAACICLPQLPSRLAAGLFAAYFAGLLWHKYSSLRALAFAFMAIIGLAVLFGLRKPALLTQNPETVLLYPDEVQVKDGCLTGIGHLKDRKLVVFGKADEQLAGLVMSGQTVLLGPGQGEISELEPATNQGQFDYRTYYAAKGISQRLKFTGAVLEGTENSPVARLHGLRRKIASRLAALPRLLAFFASELLLAQNPSQENAVNMNNYRDLGVIHILSISGMHVGIYVMALSLVCAWGRLTEEETFAVCLLFLAFEIFLSGWQPGFIRASLTYGLRQAFSLKKVRVTGADVLGLTFLLHLLVCPRLLLSTGAVLSYVLAMGLVLTPGMPKLAQSCWLNLLLTPFLLKNFYQINVCTIFYNFLVVPYFNWVVMPVSLASLLLRPFPGILRIFESILELLEGLLGKISQLGIGRLIFGQITALQLAGLFTLTAAILALLSKAPREKGEIRAKKKLTARGQLAKRLTYVLGSCYLLLYLGIHFPLKGQVTFIDVGQGDSILLTTPLLRKVYLIDTGGKVAFGGQKRPKPKPQIESITLPFLKSQGISKIDAVFVSHQDADHVGDLGPLLSEIQVDRLYFGKGLLQNPGFQKRLAGRIKQTKLVELQAGMRVLDQGGHGIDFLVLHPLAGGPGENKDSLSLACSLAGKTWAFTGDLDQAGERQILERMPDLKVDYFKLGHHGSDTSSAPDFLQRINPQLVFISAGRNNRYHHPKPETLAALRQLGIPYYSTQDCGMISWYYGLGTKPYFASFLRGRLPADP